MRHVDLRREEAAATAAEVASTLLCDTAVLPGIGVWMCWCVL